MLLSDLRHFLRTLRRAPGFTITVVLSLAIGIGANSVMFGAIKTILLDQLSARDPEALTLLGWSAPDSPASSLSGSVSFDPDTGGITTTSFSYPAFRHFQANARTLSSIVAFSEIGRLNASFGGEATMARGAMVSGNYYEGLGVQAAAGRTLSQSDDHPAAEPVAMISHAYWQSRYGGARSAVGSTIALNGKPFQIVGVEPREFSGPLDIGSAPNIIVPLSAQQALFGTSDAENTMSWWLQLLGRKRAGVTLRQVAAEIEVLLQQHVRATNPSFKDTARIHVTAVPGSRGLTEIRDMLRKPVLILAGAVSLVLLIACANVGGLLLARAMTRRREIAVRMSLGASRSALIRQLLAESVLLSLLGAAAGVALAYWARPLVPTILPRIGVQLDVAVRLDETVLAITTLIAVITGIAFGLVPALRATRIDLAPATREAFSLGSTRRNRFAGALIVVQVALAIVLVVGCGLFLRTLRHLQSAETGFDPSHVLLFRLDPTLNGYEGERLTRFYDTVHSSIAALPGVESVSLTQQTLVSGRSAMMTFHMEGRRSPEKREFVFRHLVDPEFLKTMRIPVVLGRGFTEADAAGAPKVVLVSQSLARQYFGDANPIGRRIGTRKEEPGKLEIVGVVRDTRYESMKEDMAATVYFPYRQYLDDVGPMSLAVRSTVEPQALVSAVRGAIRRIDANVPLFDIKSQTAQIEESLQQERTLAQLSTFFGAMALILSCIGLYSLMSYMAAGRTRETGVRMALGARGRDIAADVFRYSGLLVVMGIALGLAGAMALTRFVSSMIFGVEATDPASIAIAVGAMVIAAAVASWLPARRAARVDPVVALRTE